jgi:hypothetical protein
LLVARGPGLGYGLVISHCIIYEGPPRGIYRCIFICISSHVFIVEGTVGALGGGGFG